MTVPFHAVHIPSQPETSYAVEQAAVRFALRRARRRARLARIARVTRWVRHPAVVRRIVQRWLPEDGRAQTMAETSV